MPTLYHTLMYNPLVIYDQPTKPLKNVLYVSSYVPRKCGIATFCRDIAQGIYKSNPTYQTHVMALTDSVSEKLLYPKEVDYVVNQNDWAAYQEVLDAINMTDLYDLVCIQHEYGIFGGPDGEYIIPFLEQVEKPIVVTLHTIMPTPSENQKRIVQRICELADEVVVMLKGGADILSEVYQIATSNISVIPHGVPNFSKFNTEDVKKELGLDGKIVMTGINLLSEVKGVEYGIRSLPSIVKEFPNFVYQVVGETHPVFLKSLGTGRDTYREGLINLAKELGVENNLRFVNQYVTTEDLVKYVEGSDFYITPYLDPQQATSGALAYAIGAGKLCISTPYLYAKEMLGRGRGILVDFKDSEAIARSVIRLIKHPEEKYKREHRIYQIGKEMTWIQIGKQYQDIFNDLLSTQKSLYDYPTVSL